MGADRTGPAGVIRLTRGLLVRVALSQKTFGDVQSAILDIQYGLTRILDDDDARRVADDPTFQDFLTRLHRSQQAGG